MFTPTKGDHARSENWPQYSSENRGTLPHVIDRPESQA
jgi:hypothetical protein